MIRSGIIVGVGNGHVREIEQTAPVRNPRQAIARRVLHSALRYCCNTIVAITVLQCHDTQNLAAACSGLSLPTSVTLTSAPLFMRSHATLSVDCTLTRCPPCNTWWSRDLLQWSHELWSIPFVIVRSSDATSKCPLTKATCNRGIVIKWPSLRLSRVYRRHRHYPMMISVIQPDLCRKMWLIWIQQVLHDLLIPECVLRLICF